MKALGKSFLAACLVMLVVIVAVGILGALLSFVIWTGPVGILIVGFIAVWGMVHACLGYNGDF
jgi:hypothetical protein